MKFKARTDEKIYDDVKSAGQSFLGLRMENLLVRVNELDDKETKKKTVGTACSSVLGCIP